jgi:hypothetical protein
MSWWIKEISWWIKSTSKCPGGQKIQGNVLVDKGNILVDKKYK